MEEKKTRVSEWRPEPFVGRTFDGYRIEGLIGVGGMGAVFKATQLSLSRLVAIKVLNQALATDRQFLERFHREADALSRLAHPNVVTVIDRGEVDERPYLVMEYVEGTSLRAVMEKGPLPPAEALRIVSSILAALECAHERGILHRDIKPENVLLAPRGIVKVADFGLSRLLGPEEFTRLTRTHVVLGTYEYMAPEQREQAKEADERADLHATGVIFYEMLTGELPIGRFRLPSERRPAECDARIDEIVEKSLEKDPASRYQQASEMAGAVSAVLDRPPSPAEVTAVPAPERASGLAELPSAYRPQRFENHIQNLSTIDRVLGIGLCAAGAVLGAVAVATFLGGYKHPMGVLPFALALFVCVLLVAAGLGALWLSRALRSYKASALQGQIVVAIVTGLSMFLLPIAVYSVWVLFGHRGRVYYEARGRGVDPTAAAREAYALLDAPQPGSPAAAPPAPHRPFRDFVHGIFEREEKEKERKASSRDGRAAYIWWFVGLILVGILAVEGDEDVDVVSVIWIGITALLSGIGLVNSVAQGKPRGVAAAVGGLLLAVVTLVLLMFVFRIYW